MTVVARYRVDLLMTVMLLATALDAWTTFTFLDRGLGVEVNPVLAPLAAKSLVWVPIYLFATPLFVPAMPELCRQGFAGYFSSIGLLLGLNNLSGIYRGDYFLIDSIGMVPVLVLSVGVGAVSLFARALSIGSNREQLRHGLIAVGVWTLVALAVQASFGGLGLLT